MPRQKRRQEIILRSDNEKGVCPGVGSSNILSRAFPGASSVIRSTADDEKFAVATDVTHRYLRQPLSSTVAQPGLASRIDGKRPMPPRTKKSGLPVTTTFKFCWRNVKIIVADRRRGVADDEICVVENCWIVYDQTLFSLICPVIFFAITTFLVHVEVFQGRCRCLWPRSRGASLAQHWLHTDNDGRPASGKLRSCEVPPVMMMPWSNDIRGQFRAAFSWSTSLIALIISREVFWKIALTISFRLQLDLARQDRSGKSRPLDPAWTTPRRAEIAEPMVNFNLFRRLLSPIPKLLCFF